ncbi:hypothetical protein TNCV_1897501 [Trichonephila clavipes]|nr:hypothetical protein TNCV_1897501 [Trichonephila clavipes]
MGIYKRRTIKKYMGSFETDLGITNSNQETKTTPDLAPPSSSKFPTTPTGGLGASTDLTCISRSTRRIIISTTTRTHDTPATSS